MTERPYEIELTDPEKIEKLGLELAATRGALNDLLVAVRGGGDLTPACDLAQAFLDSPQAPSAIPTPNFASDEAGELAFKLNGEGKLSTAAISQIKGTGAGGAITVADIEAAAIEEAGAENDE